MDGYFIDKDMKKVKVHSKQHTRRLGRILPAPSSVDCIYYNTLLLGITLISGFPFPRLVSLLGLTVSCREPVAAVPPHRRGSRVGIVTNLL